MRCHHATRLRSPLLALVACLTAGAAEAALDLRNASVERLENGLTVILLEDRNFPVVSIQMLYRVGARSEITGQTGLAHFVEHMAFRASENFPDTGLVSSIYARGGEWHGYTWTDQTTYFATVPREHVDLLLRIEADRMERLRLSAGDMDAERGAVLAEMHLYETDPSSRLLDVVMFTSFLAHPYRNNTIGWESDVENLGHADVVAFYRRHYHPANAVLAVVGEFEPERVRKRVRDLFGVFQKKAPTPPPHTLEPLQTGERRVRLGGHEDRRLFMIGYRAPSVRHPDYAAFLVLQAMLGASSGANFLQNDWGTPADPASMLHGAAADLTTWFPPSAQDYLFVVGGRAAADRIEAEVERGIERRIARLRHEPPDPVALAAAIDEVLDELIYDVETTEDAAHQLAFFAGLGALEVLLELPRRVAAVTAGDVQRVAATYLLPERRTIAWHAPLERDAPEIGNGAAAPLPVAEDAARPGIDATPLPLPLARTLSGGLPVIVQRSDLSSSVHVQIVFAARLANPQAAPNEPLHGYTSLAFRTRPDKLTATLVRARASVSTAAPEPADDTVPAADPQTRLEQIFSEFMTAETESARAPVRPVLIVISGDIDVARTLGLLEDHFGSTKTHPTPLRAVAGRPSADVEVSLGRPVAQARLGYIVAAPGPREEGFDAWRLLLYVFSHDYEGRLGKEAISKRGLAYYIDGRYRSDGVNGWITLAVGVDPEKVDPLKALMRDELARLAEQPPSSDEIAEARAHWVGRARSAAQSNQELATALARQWLWYGELQAPAALEARLAEVDRRQVLDIIPEFIDGATITVER